MTPRQLAMFLGVSAIWGASYLQIKIALDGFDPSMIVFARVALAAVLLYIVVIARGGSDREALQYLRRHPDRAIVQGFLSVALPFMLISYGETQITSGLTGVLVAPGPLFVALFAPALDPTERVGRQGGLGLLIGFAGVILLLGIDTVHDLGEFLGAIAVLGAACSYGLGAMYAKNRFRGVPPLVVSFGACATASLMTAVPAIVTLPGTSADLGEIASVVSLGVIGTALAFVLYYSLIAETGAGKAALVGYMIPPTALLYGATLLDERVTVAAIAGLVLILAGVTLAGAAPEIAEKGPPEPA
jgi:drug/metabolite transporter (DMT)-like permease